MSIETQGSAVRFKKSRLANGLRVITESHPHSRAVSVGLWVNTGTRDEKINEAGISHLLEHMVFKGTKTRTAYQIAKSLEMYGGELNAFTSRENTCFYAHVLSPYWETALDILTDLVSNMRLTRDDFQLEKSVILQEIGMAEDQLEELVYDRYFEKALSGSALSRPILGTEKSVAQMTMKQVQQFYRRNYSPKNMVLSAAGNIDHNDLVEALERRLGRKPAQRVPEDRQKPTHKAVRWVEEKKSVEQLHLLLGIPVTTFRDSQRYEAFIVNALLGGGMTSRLYQRVREKRGLVYSIYSTLNNFMDLGLLTVYAACEPENMTAVVKNIAAEMRRLRKNKITQYELDMYRTQLQGAILLGADDVDNRMNSIAMNEFIFGKYRTVEDVIAELQSVTTKTLNEFVKKWIVPENIGGVIMGADAEKYRAWFEDFEF